MPRLRLFLFMSAAPLSACAPPCLDWQDVPLQLDLAEDPALAEDTILGALERFAGWTGRDQVCVEQIVVVEDLGEDLLGRFEPEPRRVLLQSVDAHTIHHELCHALDFELGSPSISAEGEAALSERAEEIARLSSDHYPTWRSQLREAFADLCGAGPALEGLTRLAQSTCGAEGPSAEVLFVAEQAFLAPPAYEDGFEGTFALQAERSALSETWQPRFPYSDELVDLGDELLALTFRTTQDDKPLIWPELSLLDAEGTLERFPLSPSPRSEAQESISGVSHALLGGAEAGLLLDLRGDGPLPAWRVRKDPLRLERVADLDLWPGRHGGSVVDEELVLLRGRQAPLQRVSLRDGSISPVDDPAEPRFEAPRALALSADASGAWSVHPLGETLALVERTPDGSVLAVHALPFPSIQVSSLHRLPDGSALLRAHTWASGYGGAQIIPVHFDPSTERWSLPEEGCEGFPDERAHSSSMGVVELDPVRVGDSHRYDLLSWDTR
ncbi:MAG: hypothetical protein H6741_13690 [Alphaproteobacteria bacterium]|nr:hypothetical protein [Alphaproteobacteria bacterium]